MDKMGRNKGEWNETSFHCLDCAKKDNSTTRVTKKVKTRGEDAEISSDQTMEEGVTVAPQLNFKEALINIPDMTVEDAEEMDECNDEDLPENKWYKEVEENIPKEFLSDGTPIVFVSDSELENWSEPWQ